MTDLVQKGVHVSVDVLIVPRSLLHVLQQTVGPTDREHVLHLPDLDEVDKGSQNHPHDLSCQEQYQVRRQICLSREK